MTELIVPKEKVGGEFSDKISIEYNQKKTNKILLKIGGGFFTKPLATYTLPDDYEYYTFEYNEEEETSLGKSLLKLGLLAATGEMAAGAAKSGKGGGAAALLGAATVRMGTTSKKASVSVNLQFNDKKILSMVLPYKDWKKFDDDFSVINFPNFEGNCIKSIEEVNQQIEEIRNSFPEMSKEEKATATETLSRLGKYEAQLEKEIEKARKKALKRKVPIMLETKEADV